MADEYDDINVWDKESGAVRAQEIEADYVGEPRRASAARRVHRGKAWMMTYFLDRISVDTSKVQSFPMAEEDSCPCGNLIPPCHICDASYAKPKITKDHHNVLKQISED